MAIIGGPNIQFLRKRCQVCGILNFFEIPIEGEKHCEHCGAEILVRDEDFQ